MRQFQMVLLLEKETKAPKFPSCLILWRQDLKMARMKPTSILTVLSIMVIATILLMPNGLAYATHAIPTSGDDVLVGHNDKADKINGGNGDDIISGLALKDNL